MKPIIQPWKRLETRLYEHSAYRKIEDVLFELPDGRQEWYALRKEGTVTAVLALTADQHVILARQYRPGPDRVVDELPGGGVGRGEHAVDAAIRELREETGFVPKEIMSLGTILDCAYSTIIREGFVATGCERLHQQDLDANEYIDVILKPIPEFLRQLVQGACTDPEIGWMGLYHLGLLTLDLPDQHIRRHAMDNVFVSLRTLLEHLDGLDPASIRQVFADIEQEYTQPNPDKQRIGATLEQVLEDAKETPAFSKILDKIEPLIEHAVLWLGEDWRHNDREAYTHGKTEFVQHLMQAARGERDDRTARLDL